MFIARGKEDALVTKNLVPGESVYGEKRISVEVSRQGNREQSVVSMEHSNDVHFAVG